MNIFRNRFHLYLFLAIGFLLTFSACTAMAETISATAEQVVVSDLQYAYHESGGNGYPSTLPTKYASVAALCAAYGDLLPYGPTGSPPYYLFDEGGGGCTSSSEVSPYNYYIKADTPGSILMSAERTVACATGSTWNGSDCVRYEYSCPATGGWTLEGQSCTRGDCEAGQARNPDGSCAFSCNATHGSVVSSGYYDIGTSPTGTPPASVCINHCDANFSGTSPASTAVVDGVRHYYAKGSYSADTSINGGACQVNTPNVESVTTPPNNTCSSTQTGGYVNGVWTCVDKITGTPAPNPPPVQQDTSTSQTVTNPDGSTTTTTTTNHADGSKTVTITNTAPDGTVSESQVSEGGGSSLGDASEATQKDILDQLEKTPCEKDPSGFGCNGNENVDTGTDPEGLTQEINVAITPISVGPAGSCPADQVVSFMGQPVTFTWQLPCQFASSIKPIVLVVAWLSAALIVVGGFRQNG